jgi:hypothetical protein
VADSTHGHWYAIARDDDAFTAPLHDAFESCYGTLTAPALTVAVLTYPSRRTGEVLRAYRERHIAGRYGDYSIITAALRRLEPRAAGPSDAGDDETDALDRMLDVAQRLQTSN